MPSYDYRDIQGRLPYVENLEESSLEQIGSLLEQGGLSTSGPVKEVLFCTGRQRIDSLQNLSVNNTPEIRMGPGMRTFLDKRE